MSSLLSLFLWRLTIRGFAFEFWGSIWIYSHRLPVSLYFFLLLSICFGGKALRPPLLFLEFRSWTLSTAEWHDLFHWTQRTPPGIARSADLNHPGRGVFVDVVQISLSLSFISTHSPRSLTYTHRVKLTFCILNAHTASSITSRLA